MTGLPEFKEMVRVWPYPGRRAQMDERPVDRFGGGRWIPQSGATVEWSLFHLEQLQRGALLLHPPPCEEHDFGEQRDDGKMQHDECLLCGRDMPTAQKYDAHYDEGIKLLAADEAAREAGFEDAAAMKAKNEAPAAAAAADRPAEASPHVEATPLAPPAALVDSTK